MLILNQMVHYSGPCLDATFTAISDATRRGIVEMLGREDCSITALARAFGMTPTGIKKHVAVLEQAGLVVTQKVGRVRLCRLGTRPPDAEFAWLESMRRVWATRFDALDGVVEQLKQREKDHGRTE